MLEYHAHIASLDAAKSAVLAMNEPALAQAQASVLVGAMHEGELMLLGRRLERDLHTAEPADLQILAAGQATEGDVSIHPGERLPLQIFGRIDGLPPGGTVALTVTQTGAPEGS